MESFKLSIIMPVYNEAKTLHEILARVIRTPYKKELVIVDDGSADGTVEILRDTDSLRKSLSQEAQADFDLKTLLHERNMGERNSHTHGTSCCHRGHSAHSGRRLRI